MSAETVKAWHFLPANSRTRYSDEPVKVGTTLFAKGEIVPCSNGLHASEHPVDALKYAPGFLLCRVEVSGEIVRESDKLAGRTRTCLAMVDSKRMVLEFYADLFERLFKALGVDGEELATVTKFVRDFAATGKSTNEGLDAARSAAWKLYDKTLALALARAIARAIDLAIARARAIDLAIARALAIDLARALAIDLARSNQSKIYAWARDEFQKRVEALFNGGAS